MNFSCLGVLKPTHKMSGFAARIVSTNCFSSSAFERTERRRECPGNFQFRKFRLQFFRQRLRHAGRAAVRKSAGTDSSRSTRKRPASGPGHKRGSFRGGRAILPIQTIGIPSGVQRNAPFRIFRNAASSCASITPWTPVTQM